MKPLTTAEGTNNKASVWAIAGIVAPLISTFPEGWPKWVAFETFVLAMVIINWRIEGNIPPDAADELMAEKELADVLREGRDDE
jgi:hypothetical protein